MSQSEVYKEAPDVIKLNYAGTIGLLCAASKLASAACDYELFDQIEVAISDWCELSGWSYKKIMQSRFIMVKKRTRRH